jgi:hypothetical protein
MGDLLDVHAAFGGGDEGDAAGLPVDEEREVKLARDVRAVFDVDAVDLLAGAPVCWVTSVRPSIRLASSAASSTDLAIRTPPFSPASAP